MILKWIVYLKSLFNGNETESIFWTFVLPKSHGNLIIKKIDFETDGT